MKPESNITEIQQSKELSELGASAPSLILNTAAFNQMHKLAELMASGKSTVPAHLRNTGDCMAIIMQSMQWRMNPWAVAQKTHLVNGILGYEAQLVAAVINTSGLIKSRFAFNFFGPWEKIIGKFEIKRGDKGEYRIPGWKMADEEGIGVDVSATLKGEDEARTLHLLLAQARVRNSGLWADDPKQQLAYLAQKKWARLYASDVILGVYTADELEDPKEINMGNVEVVREKPSKKTLPDLPALPFQKNVEKWRKFLLGGGTVDAIVKKLSESYTVSEDQIKAIGALKDVDTKTGEVIPAESKETAASNQGNAEWLVAFEGDGQEVQS